MYYVSTHCRFDAEVRLMAWKKALIFEFCISNIAQKYLKTQVLLPTAEKAFNGHFGTYRDILTPEGANLF